MSDRNPNFHYRRSIRLKGYDYSQAGLYFITLCVQNRERLFGEVRPKNSDNISIGDHAGSPRQQQRQRMILNDAGKMIEKWYAEMENKYLNIRCHEMIVMPNHFHCILEIVNGHSISKDDHAGSSRRDESTTDDGNTIEIAVGATLRGRPNENDRSPYGLHNKKYHPVIGNVVGWFKTMTTNEYIHGVKNRGWKRFDGKLWQRDYWEHIIRNEESYYRISNYIIQNPEKWDEDNLKN